MVTPLLPLPGGVGQRFSGVFDDAMMSGDLCNARWLGADQRLVFTAPLPMGKFTIYEAVVLETDPCILCIDSQTMIVPHAPKVGFHWEIKEICAGMGGIGLGSRSFGGTIVASLDCNELACQHLKLNQHGQVLCKDLCEDRSKAELHAINGHTEVLAAGFPCQPHSVQGLRLGSNDPRHRIYTEVLRTAYLHQTEVLLLECTPQAQFDAGVRNELQHYAAVRNHCIHEVTLALSHQWPCRRQRWWVLVYPAEWGSSPLQKWPEDTTFASLQSIIPNWGSWDIRQEEILQLTPEELQLFGSPCFGDDKRLLEMTDRAPTFLHSYGSVLAACPCGCRESGLSTVTLRQKGARGCLVISNTTGHPRYLHPVEFFALHGIPLTESWIPNMKGALCLVGQIASPLQAQWLFSTLDSILNGLTPDKALETALIELNKTQRSLIRQYFQALSPATPRTLNLLTPDGTATTILTSGCVTASQLIAAEHFTLNYGEMIHVLDGPRRLPPDQLLLQEGAHGPYQLVITHDPLPADTFQHYMIGIELRGELFIEMLCPGDFVFQALTMEQRSQVHHFENEAGHFIGLDYKVWTTMRLKACLHMDSDAPRGPPTSTEGEWILAPGLGEHIIWTALVSLTKSAKGFYDDPPLLITPALASQLLEGQLNERQLFGLPELFLKSDGHIYCIFAAKQHWALLHGFETGGLLQWTYFDGFRDSIRTLAEQLAWALSQILKIPMASFTSRSMQPQTFPHTCGTIAVIHLCQLLGLQGHLSHGDEFRLHDFLLRHQATLPKPTFTALGPPHTATADALGSLLLDKGVPAPAIEQRVNEALRILGASAIADALRSKNAWASLKGLASRPSTRFRLVKEDELRKHIEHQAKTKSGPAVSKPKNKKNAVSSSVSISSVDPSTLQLIQDTFVTEDEQPLPQLTIDEIGQDATGLGFCTLQEARPYIEAGTTISSTTLGLLITTEVPPALHGMADIRSMKFPALCTVTNEPLLIQGSLLTLSDGAIQRKTHKNPELDVLETDIVKLQVFQEEIQMDWEEFKKGPIKNVLTLMPIMKFCQGRSCGKDCPHFHAPIDESFQSVILDVWSRSWYNLSGKTTKPEVAAYFQAMLRVPTCSLTTILQAGVKGIYVEPRSSDTNGPHPDFCVIWLSSCTRDQALHRLRTCTNGLALARQHQRFGVRVQSEHEELTHKELRPGEEFVPVQINQIYSIFPIPYGVQKAQIAKLLEAWAWVAKPLQPSKGNKQGQAWTVGSDRAPPSQVLQGFDQDILVTLVKETRTSTMDQPLVASQRTKKFLKEGGALPTGSNDPWLAEDPWKTWNPTTKPAGASATASSASASRFAQIQQTISDEIKKQVEQTPPPPGLSIAGDATVNQMTVEIQELKAQGQQFHKWFHEAGTRLNQTEAQMGKLHTAMEQHTQAVTQQISAIQQEVDNKTSILQRTLQGSMAALSKDLDVALESKLTTQFDRFEALLAKRNKTE